jgi:uncharacterized membrane protein YeaQ/YmgE (transglycosylase-associated protein family)
MGFLATIIVGLIAGLIASWIMKTKTGVFIDMILGIIGGFVGGWITSLILGVNLMSGVNLTSIIVAFIGAVVVVAIYRFFKRGK